MVSFDVRYSPNGHHIQKRQKKRIAALYGERGPLVKSFLPSGRTAPVIYTVSLLEQPGITKVGRTTKWCQRRRAYADWNLAHGDGIRSEATFLITEEFVDLAKLEQHILANIGLPLHWGREWFRGEFSDVTDVVRELLHRTNLSFIEG